MAIELKLTEEQLKELEDWYCDPNATVADRWNYFKSTLDDYLALRALVTKLDEGLAFYGEDNWSGCHSSGWKHIHLGDKESYRMAEDLRSFVPDQLKAK